MKMRKALQILAALAVIGLLATLTPAAKGKTHAGNAPGGLAKAESGTANKGDNNGQGHCTDETVKGSYGVAFDGSIFTLGQVKAAARIEFDGRGGLTGSYVESVSGIIKRGGFNGSYSVNEDCTGSAKLSGLVPGSWSVDLQGVIVNEGKEMFLVATDTGLDVSGSAKKQ